MDDDQAEPTSTLALALSSALRSATFLLKPLKASVNSSTLESMVLRAA